MTQESGDKCYLCSAPITSGEVVCQACIPTITNWKTDSLIKKPMEPIDHQSKQSILQHIEEIINKLDTDHILTPSRKNWLAKHYVAFVLESALKYIAGQKEHGDGIEESNPLAQMRGELYDFFHYYNAATDPLIKPIITAND